MEAVLTAWEGTAPWCAEIQQLHSKVALAGCDAEGILACPKHLPRVD